MKPKYCKRGFHSCKMKTLSTYPVTYFVLIKGCYGVRDCISLITVSS